MKTFLGNSPWYDENNPTQYGVRAGSRWPHFQNKAPHEKIGSYVPFPHFLASAAAILEADGKDVLLTDGVAEGITVEEFVQRIKDYGPKLVLLEVSTPSIHYDLEIAKRIKGECGDLKIAFCGIHAPMSSNEFLLQNPVVDFVLFGEYEYTLRELVREFQNSHSFQKVQGLIYRDLKGGAWMNPGRPLIENLDELPFYACHFLPMENYRDTPCGLPTPSVQMWTSRGCPFQCSFCAWPQILYGGNRYRVRSIHRVLDELELLVGKYGFKSFYFDDDTVNIGKKRMLELCRAIKQRFRLPWGIMARADNMDRELLTAFKEAGLYSLKYGVESGDQDLVDRSGKKLSLDKVREVAAITRELGIKTHLTFAFGLPGETKATIQKTIDFALELDPDSIQFSLVTPFPGSRLYELARDKGWLVSEDWTQFNGSSSSVVCTEHLTAQDLEGALKNAYESWNRHQRQKKRKKGLREADRSLLKTMGKTLVIRSSYLEHFEEVLELATLEKGGKVSVLGQPAITERFEGNARIQRFFIYGEGFLCEDVLKDEMLEEIRNERFHTVIILYNNSPMETYKEVEKLAWAFKSDQIIGVDSQYRFRVIGEEFF